MLGYFRVSLRDKMPAPLLQMPILVAFIEWRLPVIKIDGKCPLA
jgi:hypothetical protein